MIRRTAEEARAEHIEKMGLTLGEQYHALWNDVAWLHNKWREYQELFGTKPSRVKLLNKAAPTFFRLVQDTLWEDILLHIARLTDASTIGSKKNLSICNLPGLLTSEMSTAVGDLIDVAREKSQFCRDWRNRRIAHRDLDVSLDRPAVPLKNGSRQDVSEVLAAIAAVMSKIHAVYTGSEISFGPLPGYPGGALSLLHVINDGVRSANERKERIEQGSWSKEDFCREDL